MIVLALDIMFYFIIFLLVMDIGEYFERKHSLYVKYIFDRRPEIYFYQLLKLDGYCHRVRDIFHIFCP